MFTTILHTTSDHGIDWRQPYHSPDVAADVADALRRSGFTVTTEEYDPDVHADVKHGGATLAEIRTAEDAGRRAHADSAPNAPGADPIIRVMIGGAEVGDPRTITLMRAFSAAYQAACDEAAAAILATV